jgi:hypothetical protein
LRAERIVREVLLIRHAEQLRLDVEPFTDALYEHTDAARIARALGRRPALDER